MFKPKSTQHILMLALLAFFSLSESLPLAHHHEHEGHPCLQLNGDYFYIETADHREADHLHPTITGIELGESHNHLECALCQLASYGFAQSFPLKHPLGSEATSIGRPNDRQGTRFLSHALPRGPPKVPSNLITI